MRMMAGISPVSLRHLVLAALLAFAPAGLTAKAGTAEAPTVAPAAITAAAAAPTAPGPQTAADPLAALINDLASDDFSAKLAAIQGMAALGDGRAAPVLEALEGGLLYATADHRLVYSEDAGDPLTIADPITRAPLGTAPAGELDNVVVNNSLRNAIEAALSGLQLFSPDPKLRLSAAVDAAKHPSAEIAKQLEAALGKEKDPAIRQAIQHSLSVAWLKNGSAEDQLRAVKTLSGSVDGDIHGLIEDLSKSPSATPEVRQAAAEALAHINRKLFWIGLAGNLFQGVSLGSVLLLAAIGLAITFGVMGVINMAHGEMIMLGAYAAYVVQQVFRAYLPPGWIDGYLLVAIPVAFLTAGLVGVVLERTVIRFLYGRPLETLLATWGISLILQQLVRSIFGAPNKAVSNPSWMVGGFEVMGFTVTWNRLVIILFCFIVLGAIALILRRTAFGLHMRAVTQNRGMAAAMGIATDRVDALTFGLGSGIAGMAGVALSQIGNVSPNLGTVYIVDSFLVVVFGGVGNLLGTLFGAMSLGIVNKFLEPFAGAVLGKILVLVAIILFIQKRPRGLFAMKGRAAEI